MLKLTLAVATTTLLTSQPDPGILPGWAIRPATLRVTMQHPAVSRPQEPQQGWFQGMASWYRPKQQHVRMWGTRNLAAHRTLRPGTRLRVTHGRRSVTVIVCGRGPFVRGRSLDLSRSAFRALAPTSRGVLRVEYRKVELKPCQSQ